MGWLQKLKEKAIPGAKPPPEVSELLEKFARVKEKYAGKGLEGMIEQRREEITLLEDFLAEADTTPPAKRDTTTMKIADYLNSSESPGV